VNYSVRHAGEIFGGLVLLCILAGAQAIAAKAIMTGNPHLFRASEQTWTNPASGKIAKVDAIWSIKSDNAGRGTYFSADGGRRKVYFGTVARGSNSLEQYVDWSKKKWADIYKAQPTNDEEYGRSERTGRRYWHGIFICDFAKERSPCAFDIVEDKENFKIMFLGIKTGPHSDVDAGYRDLGKLSEALWNTDVVE
jgi:hypothetical protein